MGVQEQIDGLIAQQPHGKSEDLQALHRRITALSPGCRLWFVSGRNDEGKVVANPSVGYGTQTRTYANGEAREFYRVGMSPSASGISLYLMGIEDRNYLPETYGGKLGKAKVTGYCISFRSLKDVDVARLEEAIAAHLNGRRARRR